MTNARHSSRHSFRRLGAVPPGPPGCPATVPSKPFGPFPPGCPAIRQSPPPFPPRLLSTFGCQVPRQAVQGSKKGQPPFLRLPFDTCQNFPRQAVLDFGREKKVCRYVGRWLVFESISVYLSTFFLFI